MIVLSGIEGPLNTNITANTWLIKTNKETNIMSKLAQLRAKLLEKENRQRSAASDNAMYPFWNINENEMAILRFLPDGVPNDFFWVEAQKIRLTFPGIVGQQNTTGRDILVQVPCNEMFGGTCPILTEVRPWFKEPTMDQIARQYWKKRSYIFQGFVRENPLREDDGPENPIRRFIINPSIYDIIKAALMDEEMEEMPTDYVSGTDFRLVKTTQGQYASYKTSTYSRKTSSLTEEELAIVEKYGLKNLSDFLPKRPGDRELEIIKEMFDASVDGQLYDPERWAEFYKPAGLEWSGTNGNGSRNSTTESTESTSSTDSTTKTVETEVEAVSTESSTVVEETITPEVSIEPKKDPKDILAAIKARADQRS